MSTGGGAKRDMDGSLREGFFFDLDPLLLEPLRDGSSFGPAGAGLASMVPPLH